MQKALVLSYPCHHLQVCDLAHLLLLLLLSLQTL
jgi:hypothetical protein